MTVKEVIEKLSNMPEDAELLYLHNQYGRIAIDTIDLKEEKTLTGRTFHTVTFSGEFEED